MRTLGILLVLAIISFFGAVWMVTSNSGESLSLPQHIAVSDALGSADNEGYQMAIEPRKFTFPADYSSHPGFRTEWWYFTGHLTDDAKDHDFGFQFTFFTQALSPKLDTLNSEWQSNQMLMGHFGLSDISGQRHHYREILGRLGSPVATLKNVPLEIQIEDWKLEEKAGDTFYISASKEDPVLGKVRYELEIVNQKAIVLQGDSGLSQKGPGVGNASYYYSMPRMLAKGKVWLGEEVFEVNGEAWLDREWSTSALNENQEGWDWFSIQLDDQREIMYYQLRNKDGSLTAQSKGTIVRNDGSYESFSHEMIDLEVLDTWVNNLGMKYPSGWKFSLPEEDLELIITPNFKAQEMATSVRYWEGACEVSGSSSGESISGQAYVELTGY